MWVDRREIRRIAHHLGLALDDFGRRYLRQVGRRLALTERADRACVFWDQGCTIYADRPRQCRTFPFWTKVLEKRERWDETARMCGGMNQGRLYSSAEIEALERGVGEAKNAGAAENVGAAANAGDTAGATDDGPRPASRLRIVE